MKNARSWIRYWLIVCFSFGLVGCFGKSTSNAPPESSGFIPTTAIPQVLSADDDPIVASGEIKPVLWLSLTFQTSGVVEEVKVKAGDQVVTDELLAKLDTAFLELSLQTAQQELYARQSVLDEEISQILSELQLVQLQLEELKAQDHTSRIATAKARIEELTFQLDQARVQDLQPQVEMARAQVTRAQIVYDYAQAEYLKALDRPWEPQEVRDAYARTLQQAELDLQIARSELDGALDAQQAHAIDLKILTAQLDAAQAELEQVISAQKAYSITLESMAVQVDSLRTQRDLYLGDGSNEPMTEARARLEQARLAVAELELQVHQAELRAPFDGTVVAVWVHPGETVDAGQSGILLAKLDEFYFETTDLSQSDLAHLQSGLLAEVSLDAFPEVTLSGYVSEIVLYELENDLVKYAVRVALEKPEQAPLELRWGMTGIVQIMGPSASPTY